VVLLGQEASPRDRVGDRRRGDPANPVLGVQSRLGLVDLGRRDLSVDEGVARQSEAQLSASVEHTSAEDPTHA
jgi:hypothetical protein